MKTSFFRKQAPTKIRTTITLDPRTLNAARKMNINISAVCQHALENVILEKARLKKIGEKK